MKPMEATGQWGLPLRTLLHRSNAQLVPRAANPDTDSSVAIGEDDCPPTAEQRPSHASRRRTQASETTVQLEDQTVSPVRPEPLDHRSARPSTRWPRCCSPRDGLLLPIQASDSRGPAAVDRPEPDGFARALKPPTDGAWSLDHRRRSSEHPEGPNAPAAAESKG